MFDEIDYDEEEDDYDEDLDRMIKEKLLLILNSM
jgi:hypothetical protein